MEGGEKRKRVRKRPNRGGEKSRPSNGTEEGSEKVEAPVTVKKQHAEQQAGPSVVAEKGPLPLGLHKESSGRSEETSESGPKLSFYQRTNPHKPSALSSLAGGSARKYTVSVALPGSIVMNAQTPELQARLAGQIARCCAIFTVDEIVIFDEGKGDVDDHTFAPSSSSHWQRGRGPNGAQGGVKRRWADDGDGNGQEYEAYNDDGGDQRPQKTAFDPNAFLARILQYVETPQYLRKALFPMHRDLRLAGLLAPLDCPHHLRFEDKSPYREGVCVEEPHWSRHTASSSSPSRAACWVDVGLRDPIACPLPASSDGVPVGARVTVKMPSVGSAIDKKGGKLVSPREPVEQRGLYWGYTVRLCSSLSEAISNSSFNEPYDFVVGTSERGTSLDELVGQVAQSSSSSSAKHHVDGGFPSSFTRALIVFGGLSGLEVAVERDENINATADEASQLFDAWVNVVENQGSRTIRTEEALFIALARLKSVIERLGARQGGR